MVFSMKYLFLITFVSFFFASSSFAVAIDEVPAWLEGEEMLCERRGAVGCVPGTGEGDFFGEREGMTTDIFDAPTREKCFELRERREDDVATYDNNSKKCVLRNAL